MDQYESIVAAASASLNEIEENISLREDFKALFVGRAGEIYHHDRIRDSMDLRGLLDRALARKSVSEDPLNRGLYVEVVSVLERSVKSIVGATVRSHESAFSKFSEYPGPFQNKQLSNAGKALTHIGAGHVSGVTFDFEALKLSLENCLSDGTPVLLSGDSFTTFLGNCTPGKLRTVFLSIGIEEPFDDKIALSAAAVAWSNGLAGRDVTNAVKAGLKSMVETRNNIVHGPLAGTVITSDNVRMASRLVSTLVDVFVEKARRADLSRVSDDVEE